MSPSLLHLINLLEDEFRGEDRIRIRPVFPSGTRRSIDLPQDYDPDSSSVHSRSGVIVQTPRRDYFFPETWMTETARAQINRQIEEIHHFMADAG